MFWNNPELLRKILEVIPDYPEKFFPVIPYYSEKLFNRTSSQNEFIFENVSALESGPGVSKSHDTVSLNQPKNKN